MDNSLKGKAVLITGGTRGIGLATGLAFGRQGALCTLTNRWGSADEDEILSLFEKAGAPAPHIVQADSSNDDDTAELLQAMKARHESIEVFVSNVALASIVKSFESYQKRALFKSIEYTAWPMFAYTRSIHKVFGKYPRYVIGMSSDGPEQYCTNYDYVAACKALMETLMRYTSYHLCGEDVRVNVVRAGYVLTESLRATFGDEFEDFSKRFGMEKLVVTPEEVANVILALCSGLLDGVNGQIVMADRGTSFMARPSFLQSQPEVIKTLNEIAKEQL
jgi:NAD(P)-dependent dehydrogenase (short-subunit alcohol dehydrogenase family)